SGFDPAPLAPASILAAADPRLPASLAAAVGTWTAALGQPVPLSISVQVAGLPSGILAEAAATAFDDQGRPITGQITVSPTAGGTGWFIDPTPLDSAEFDRLLSSAAALASAGSPASGRYDLETVLLHEVGHLLGFNSDLPIFSRHVAQSADGRPAFVGPGFTALLSGDHLDAATNPGDLMDATLASSVRERPSWLDARIIATTRDTSSQSPDVGESPSAAPVVPPDRGSSAVAAASRGSFGRSTADAMAISPPITQRPGPLPMMAAPSAILANATAAGYRVETEDQE